MDTNTTAPSAQVLPTQTLFFTNHLLPVPMVEVYEHPRSAPPEPAEKTTSSADEIPPRVLVEEAQKVEEIVQDERLVDACGQQTTAEAPTEAPSAWQEFMASHNGLTEAQWDALMNGGTIEGKLPWETDDAATTHPNFNESDDAADGGPSDPKHSADTLTPDVYRPVVAFPCDDKHNLMHEHCAYDTFRHRSTCPHCRKVLYDLGDGDWISMYELSGNEPDLGFSIRDIITGLQDIFQFFSTVEPGHVRNMRFDAQDLVDVDYDFLRPHIIGAVLFLMPAVTEGDVTRPRPAILREFWEELPELLKSEVNKYEGRYQKTGYLKAVHFRDGVYKYVTKAIKRPESGKFAVPVYGYQFPGVQRNFDAESKVIVTYITWRGLARFEGEDFMELSSARAAEVKEECKEDEEEVSGQSLTERMRDASLDES